MHLGVKSYGAIAGDSSGMVNASIVESGKPTAGNLLLHFSF